METLSMELINDTELNNISGGDVVDWISAGCLTWGTIVWASSGTASANPVGGTVSAFCLGFAIGRAIWG